MNTIQIEEIIERLYPLNRIFQGVYPIDKLHHIRRRHNSAVILNTAPSTHPGIHWVAVACFNGKQEYFDSYGLPPPQMIKTKLLRKKYKFNKKPVQDIFSASCGAHCIFYLYHRARGNSIQETIKMMNEKRVIEFIHPLMSPHHYEELMRESRFPNQRSQRTPY